MANELYIDVTAQDEKIAYLKDRKLTEFYQEKKGKSIVVGDVFVGSIKKILPGNNAAFLNIGLEKDAFIHYSDLGPNIKSFSRFSRIGLQGGLRKTGLEKFQLEPETLKTGNVSEVLKRNQQILVQVLKEPISSKGPRVTTEITVAGTYCILIPFHESINISKKIVERPERSRLKSIVNKYKPKNFGFVLRTAAQNVSEEMLKKDIEDLLKIWTSMVSKLNGAQTGDKVLGEPSFSISIVRDYLGIGLTNIVTNDAENHKQIENYLQHSNSPALQVLKLHKGQDSVFEHFGINKQLKTSFGKTVSFSSGSYLVIEHTEALHVIDVNSGSNHKKEKSQEENAHQINLEAAREIARQIRLRDMGGIIVIDFIDIKKPAFKKEIVNELITAMKSDRANHTILPMSKFCVVQLTRERVRPETNIVTEERCPMCQGTGKVNSSQNIENDIESSVKYIAHTLNLKKVKILTHPFISAYFKKGLISKRFRWRLDYNLKVDLKPDSSLHYGEFHIFDENDEEIKL
ncbi:MAG: Rne/Rng family ribonuclease [Flavobacteriales bacterium]|nr:Rne/Rng family ribonuclease [Flavobacteriales bacterium]